jgi:UDP-N-acetylglucosamine 1-carboxyvinyltransferase
MPDRPAGPWSGGGPPEDAPPGAVAVVGGNPLRGAVTPQGGKGAALLLYAAMLVPDGEVRLVGVPAILDTGVAAELARVGGHDVARDGDVLRVTSPAAGGAVDIPTELGARGRFTVSAAAAILARTGRVSFPHPGGDGFCPRPIDLHLGAMRAAGADLDDDDGRVVVRLPAGGPKPFKFSASTAYGPSVGATATALILAARAAGTSLITSPSQDPDVDDLVAFLTGCGVGVQRRFDGALEVSGLASPTGTTYRLPPDRIESGTLAIAALLTGGAVLLRGMTEDRLGAPVAALLRQAGGRLDESPDGLAVTAEGGGAPCSLTTRPHPGFPTDLQPQTTVLLTRLPGVSTIAERVFAARASHVAGLRRFGARIEEHDGTLTVHGPARLTGADVVGTDIRCAVAYVLAALVADGRSTVGGMYHVRRGHGDLFGALRGLGADIRGIHEGPVTGGEPA